MRVTTENVEEHLLSGLEEEWFFSQAWMIYGILLYSWSLISAHNTIMYN